MTVYFVVLFIVSDSPFRVDWKPGRYWHLAGLPGPHYGSMDRRFTNRCIDGASSRPSPSSDRPTFPDCSPAPFDGTAERVPKRGWYFGEPQKTVGFPSLKELFVSRASWRFFAHGPRQSPVGLFSNGCLVEESVWELGCRGHVLRGCSRRSFLVRRHPYPSLRESACLYGSRSGPLGPDTEYSAATVSRTPGRLNQKYARQRRPSPLGHSDWPCVREGLFFREEGPMQPSFVYAILIFLVPEGSLPSSVV